MDATRIKDKARLRRADVITMIHRSGAGHVGGALSCTDILCTLLYGVVQGDDVFLLSKGHSVEGYWAILSDLGFFPRSELNTFSQAGSRLIGHPNNKVPGVKMCTGALGHALSVGVGYALAKKRDNADARTFVLMGDGEQAEGSIWEAAMAASQYKLDALTAIVDRNGLQISGATEDVMALEPFGDKWRAFGWDVQAVDGHDIGALLKALSSKNDSGKPRLLIANTIKGKGLPCAEGQISWHHKVPNEQQVNEAYAALGVKGVDFS